jgi:hypothetical protein
MGALEIIVISLVGATLGLRFRVLILIPAVILAMLGAAVVGIARGDQFLSVIVAMILFGTAIQIGYLAGIVARVGLASVRARGRSAVATRKLSAP